MIRWITPLLISVMLFSGCAGRLADRPGVYQAEKISIQQKTYTLNPVLVKPAAPSGRAVLVLFASGDSGLRGLSKTILQHLADRGYYVAGFSSREVVGEFKGSRERIPYSEAVEHLKWVTREAKAKLGLPPDTPIIVTGLSRGANMVILAASTNAIRDQIAGAIAIALTKEMDYLSLPKSAMNLPGVKLDEEQRPQNLAAISRIGSIPLAIINSTTDHYVSSGEWRRLIGPDTPTRHVYEVNSKGHSFGGGKSQMLRDLDIALDWITQAM
jgi:alpha-beta hydrolase superfamily lysophospholipase